MNRDERGSWYLLTGFMLGVILGLVYAWVIQPVKYVNTAPASLRKDFKDQYRALIAAAYLGNSDLVRAKARLGLLQDQDMFRALSEQAQRSLAASGSSSEARALGMLAIALGQAPPGPAIAITQERLPGTVEVGSPTSSSMEIEGTEVYNAEATQLLDTEALVTATPLAELLITFTPQPTAPPTEVIPPTAPEPTLDFSPTPEVTLPPSETPIPRPTYTPTPTRTPSLTPGAPFVLLSRDKICTQALNLPLVQIEALNRFNQPVAGVPVIVNWAGGKERFYTGLKPEKGLGYADYTLSPGVSYTLRLGESGEPVHDLSAAQCLGTDGKYFWGAWLLKFVQP
jgi:hypothetical protein